MYLEKAVVENSGPLRWLNISLEFSNTGNPKPVILVGGNGSGKTNFLSMIVDALFEAAAVHYDNVLPTKGSGRAWFRVVGGRTITTGAAGSFSLLKFNDDGAHRIYREKAGNLDPTKLHDKVPVDFLPNLNWNVEGSLKDFPIDEKRSEAIFEKGVYAYFPSSRSESPYWLNKEAISTLEFEVDPAFSRRLTKPIYIERALASFKQWLLSVLADCRTEIWPNHTENGVEWNFRGDPQIAMNSSHVLSHCNKILQEIFGDNTIRFVWMGRKSPDKIGVARGNELAFPNIDALSTGQAILLGMFGTLLRYGDLSQSGSGVDLEEITGICVIDEVDAHIHIDLQHSVLPKIMKLFPKIQFIVSSHSPVFVLGMEKSFMAEGIQVIDMPNGVPVGAEAYIEFEKALNALSASQAFTKRVVEEASAHAMPVVYVEGETDAPYIISAALALGKSDLLKACSIEWIGARDSNGQGFHTGADALRNTQSVLKANPDLSNRKILLLNDNDSKTIDHTSDKLWVRKINISDANKKVRAGIENLLPEGVITDEFYQLKSVTKPNGDVVTSKSLRKSALCEKICAEPIYENFINFGEVLSIIEEFIGKSDFENLISK
ncbi:AAA family ATPase [Sphingomonas sanguinis]|uniref:AAA family ATPase n=1 Tax=Sphingomonas sanguinis TaxID=33051 RepID=UPI0009E6EF0E|nr:AAA family ATPase [Sphingomonas sanguinis]